MADELGSARPACPIRVVGYNSMTEMVWEDWDEDRFGRPRFADRVRTVPEDVAIRLTTDPECIGIFE